LQKIKQEIFFTRKLGEKNSGVFTRENSRRKLKATPKYIIRTYHLPGIVMCDGIQTGPAGPSTKQNGYDTWLLCFHS
jgi:hypothetical protein